MSVAGSGAKPQSQIQGEPLAPPQVGKPPVEGGQKKNGFGFMPSTSNGSHRAVNNESVSPSPRLTDPKAKTIKAVTAQFSSQKNATGTNEAQPDDFGERQLKQMKDPESLPDAPHAAAAAKADKLAEEALPATDNENQEGSDLSFGDFDVALGDTSDRNIREKIQSSPSLTGSIEKATAEPKEHNQPVKSSGEHTEVNGAPKAVKESAGNVQKEEKSVLQSFDKEWKVDEVVVDKAYIGVKIRRGDNLAADRLLNRFDSPSVKHYDAKLGHEIKKENFDPHNKDHISYDEESNEIFGHDTSIKIVVEKRPSWLSNPQGVTFTAFNDQSYALLATKLSERMQELKRQKERQDLNKTVISNYIQSQENLKTEGRATSSEKMDEKESRHNFALNEADSGKKMRAEKERDQKDDVNSYAKKRELKKQYDKHMEEIKKDVKAEERDSRKKESI